MHIYSNTISLTRNVFIFKILLKYKPEELFFGNSVFVQVGAPLGICYCPGGWGRTKFHSPGVGG